MNDNAEMLNTNTSPTIMVRIPIIILTAENPDIINAIPKNTKLNPIIMDNAAVLKTGKIIKSNPNIIDIIPDILFGSIFFSSKNCHILLKKENERLTLIVFSAVAATLQ